MAKKMGKTRVIAETGAGQHGVATATAAALLGLECEIFMGKEDTDRQDHFYKIHMLFQHYGFHSLMFLEYIDPHVFHIYLFPFFVLLTISIILLRSLIPLVSTPLLTSIP